MAIAVTASRTFPNHAANEPCYEQFPTDARFGGPVSTQLFSRASEVQGPPEPPSAEYLRLNLDVGVPRTRGAVFQFDSFVGQPREENRFQTAPCGACWTGESAKCFHPQNAGKQAPPLLRALQKNDVTEIKKVLQAEPEVASFPFEDHKWEPPLCAAARLHCHPSVFDLLIEYGADVEQENVQGKTALEVLVQIALEQNNQASSWDRVFAERNLPNSVKADPALAEFCHASQKKAEHSDRLRRQHYLTIVAVLLAAGTDAERAVAACSKHCEQGGEDQCPGARLRHFFNCR